MADYIPTNTPSAHAPVVQWRIEGAQNVDPVELKPYLTDDPRQAGNGVALGIKRRKCCTVGKQHVFGCLQTIRIEVPFNSAFHVGLCIDAMQFRQATPLKIGRIRSKSCTWPCSSLWRTAALYSRYASPLFYPSFRSGGLDRLRR